MKETERQSELKKKKTGREEVCRSKEQSEQRANEIKEKWGKRAPIFLFVFTVVVVVVVVAFIPVVELHAKQVQEGLGVNHAAQLFGRPVFHVVLQRGPGPGSRRKLENPERRER
jgi:hypothetical protein